MSEPPLTAGAGELLGSPHLTLTWADFERCGEPIIYVWTRASAVLYVGLSFAGLERPIARSHARLRHFQPGDHLAVWRVPSDPGAPYDLIARHADPTCSMARSR